MKRLVMLRTNYQSFGRGTLEFIFPENRKVIVFTRRFQDEIILVVANLSRFVNFVELDLSQFKGMAPVELFGHTRFPSIGELPYFLTLGPHSFYWFKLDPPRISSARAAAETFEPPRFDVVGTWNAIFRGAARAALERALPGYLLTCRWFGGKAQPIRSVKLAETLAWPADAGDALFTVWEVQYTGGGAERYLLPLAFAAGSRAFEVRQASPQSIIAELHVRNPDGESEGLLHDALYDPAFCKSLVDAIARGRRSRSNGVELHAQPSKPFRALAGSEPGSLEPSLLKGEQSNTSIVFGDRLILKFFRRLSEGTNPDLEISRFLTERIPFTHTPPLAGWLELRKGRNEPASLAILKGLVANEGDAWRYTLDSLGGYFEEILTRHPTADPANVPEQSLIELSESEIPQTAQELLGGYLSCAQLLGKRSGELHTALARDSKDPAFAPEPLTALYRRSLYQSLRTLADQSLSLLARKLAAVPEATRPDAEKVVALENAIFSRYKRLLERKLTGMIIRCHGDFHLGQVLYTGRDFVIIDFEGEPARSMTERRLKRSPMRDVAGMVRSFNYAAHSKLKSSGRRPEDAAQLRPWARFWDVWASVAFLRGYRQATANASFMPKSQEELSLMLDIFILDKAIYELSYELNNRPDWVDIPIAGITEIIRLTEHRP
jgi:maltose alpha-D-glucosyltransferase/alpha-amylase